MSNKEHESLGDDVYIGVDSDEWHMVIYTKANDQKIYLEPDVFERLYKYMKEAYKNDG